MQPTIEQLIALIELLNSKEIRDATIAEEWWLADPDADEQPNHEES
jgi:hypothetical protein